MAADIGTRKGAKVEDVSEGSVWINGYSWMSGPVEEFPAKTIKEITLSGSQEDEANAEKVSVKTFYNRNHMGFNKRGIYINQLMFSF